MASDEGPEHAATAGRPTLPRRRRLPTGRALVGALLVTIAAIGVFAAYASAGGHQGRPVVVAAEALVPGAPIDPDQLEVRDLDLPADLESRTFSSIGELGRAVALAPIGAGELIQASAVRVGDRSSPPGGREFTFAIERDRAVDGGLRAGELVDVLATYGTGDSAYTIVAARSATVTSVSDGGSASLTSAGTVVIGLSLADPDEVLGVAHASEVGAVTVVRSNSDGAPLPDGYQAPGSKATASSSDGS